MRRFKDLLHSITHKHATMTHKRLPNVMFGLCSSRLLRRSTDFVVVVHDEKVRRSFFIENVVEHQLSFLLDVSETLTDDQNLTSLVARLRSLNAHEMPLEEGVIVV